MTGRVAGRPGHGLRRRQRHRRCPEGEHERIFEEFHRAHHRDYEGSGLGLAICRRIVTRHGGTIVARDNPAGRGTVFEFTLPAYVRPAAVTGTASRSAADGAGAGPVPQRG